jgi:hypothetical protein
MQGGNDLSPQDNARGQHYTPSPTKTVADQDGVELRFSKSNDRVVQNKRAESMNDGGVSVPHSLSDNTSVLSNNGRRGRAN